MYKAKLMMLAVTVAASPLALFLAKLAFGTKTGGTNDGGYWAT